eukprot:1461416-Prymnesium_polylepis.1
MLSLGFDFLTAIRFDILLTAIRSDALVAGARLVHAAPARARVRPGALQGGHARDGGQAGRVGWRGARGDRGATRLERA